MRCPPMNAAHALSLHQRRAAFLTVPKLTLSAAQAGGAMHELLSMLTSLWRVSADSKLLLTACDDMHSHLYDVENGALVEAFSGRSR